VIGESLLQISTLFVTEVCEERVGDNVVFSAEVVDAL
jgi:hypothetical protein